MSKEVTKEQKNRILAEFMGYEVAKAIDKMAQLEEKGSPSSSDEVFGAISEDSKVECLWLNNAFVMRLDQYVHSSISSSSGAL